MKTRVAIFASGEGTTAEAFIQACAAGQVDAEPVLLVCNREDAGVLARIERCNQRYGFSTTAELMNSQRFPAAKGEPVVPGGQTAAEEAAILQLLADKTIDLVLLMGYMRRIGPRLVREYGWRPGYNNPYQARMLNTHPGLLPATKGFYGTHVQEHVLASGLKTAGQTLHVVSENYDEGPVIAENRVPVQPDDTPESLFDRVRETERRQLPVDIQAFIIGRRQWLKQTGAVSNG
jgi:phosphoribosylglycinamide formyltransferase-1